jgi:hypothetical protein
MYTHPDSSILGVDTTLFGHRFTGPRVVIIVRLWSRDWGQLVDMEMMETGDTTEDCNTDDLDDSDDYSKDYLDNTV